jgi:hypothetical protein
VADRPSQTPATPDRPVRQCRDIFVHQIAAALAELDAGKPNVHGARKQLKRARGTLRVPRGRRCKSCSIKFGSSPPDVHLGHGSHKLSSPQVARIRDTLENGARSRTGAGRKIERKLSSAAICCAAEFPLLFSPGTGYA